jgi:hypothetical protein
MLDPGTLIMACWVELQLNFRKDMGGCKRMAQKS